MKRNKEEEGEQPDTQLEIAEAAMAEALDLWVMDEGSGPCPYLNPLIDYFANERRRDD